MAVDTRNKRASCLGIALAVTLTLPLADGTVAQADRQQVTFCYSGIISAPVADVLTRIALPGLYEPTIRLSGLYEPTITLPGRAG